MSGVLVTRPEADAAVLMEAIAAMGLTPYHAPMMTINQLHGAPPPPDHITALAVTSANGVRAFCAASPRRDIPVFAVGGVSAAVAREAGFPVSGVADNTVESLAALITSRLRDQRETGRPHDHSRSGFHHPGLYHPVGRHEAGDLVGTLMKAGISAQKAVLYEATPRASLPPVIITQIKSGGIDWVTALSPRTAQYLGAALEQAGLQAFTARLRAAVFSPAVAAALKPRFSGRICIASAPKISHLIDILAVDTH